MAGEPSALQRFLFAEDPAWAPNRLALIQQMIHDAPITDAEAAIAEALLDLILRVAINALDLELWAETVREAARGAA